MREAQQTAMKIVRAEVLGFCMGVRRAVEAVSAVLDDVCANIVCDAGLAHGGIYTLGPLIHNPLVLENLKQKGIGILDEKNLPADLSGVSVIIRAHGVSPKTKEELVRRGAKVIDATCPHVRASQMKARSLSAEGFCIFLAGEKDHGEIAGIRGYIRTTSFLEDCFVVANPREAEQAAADYFRGNPHAKTALIAQTTITAAEYMAIGEGIKKFFPGLEIVNTICNATLERQDALRELCGQVDAILIAGGRESANTRRLLSIAEGLGKKAALVENAAEIPPEFFSYSVVGLSAGASTPGETIDELERALQEAP
jgi:4-hydroxy-3-methylbut-2-enyl diphosphate reductase